MCDLRQETMWHLLHRSFWALKLLGGFEYPVMHGLDIFRRHLLQNSHQAQLQKVCTRDHMFDPHSNAGAFLSDEKIDHLTREIYGLRDVDIQVQTLLGVREVHDEVELGLATAVFEPQLLLGAPRNVAELSQQLARRYADLLVMRA